MTSGRATTARRLVDPVLWATGVFAALLPVLHEELGSSVPAMPPMDGMPESVTPVAVAYLLIAAKVIVATMLAGVLFALAARGRTFAEQLAGLPLVRGSALAGAAAAIGLSAFDFCTRFHGADMDTAGACHCWTTAAIAATIAFAGGLAMLWGRIVVAFARRIVGRIAALVLSLAPSAGAPVVNRVVAAPLMRGGGSSLARRLAGRAPPSSV